MWLLAQYMFVETTWYGNKHDNNKNLETKHIVKCCGTPGCNDHLPDQYIKGDTTISGVSIPLISLLIILLFIDNLETVM